MGETLRYHKNFDWRLAFPRVCEYDSIKFARMTTFWFHSMCIYSGKTLDVVNFAHPKNQKIVDEYKK